MRIGLMGAHGVGKTTLLKALVGTPELEEYAFLPGFPRRTSRETGIALSQQGTFETQKVIVKALASHVRSFANIVIDRTFLDGYAYTLYMHEKGILDSTQVNYIRTRVMKHQPMFDLVVYIRPEFPVVGDGVRPDDPGYALSIAATMERVVHNKDYMGSGVVLEIKGTVEERVAAVTGWIKAHENGIRGREVDQRSRTDQSVACA